MALVLGCLALLLHLRGAAAVCYTPNGTVQLSDYNPCFALQGSSFCCATQKGDTANNASEHDSCLPNGLCQWITDGGAYQYWREGCTNDSWPEEWCLKGVCTDANDNDSHGNAQLTPCQPTTESQTWCCGQNNTACCGKGAPAEITLAKTLAGYATLTSTVGPTRTPTAITTATSAAPTPTQKSKNGNGGGARLGVGVGVGVGLVALLVALATLWLLLNRKKKAYRAANQVADDSGQLYDTKMQPGSSRDTPQLIELASAPVPARSELESDRVGTELEAPRDPVELDATSLHQEQKDYVPYRSKPEDDDS